MRPLPIIAALAVLCATAASGCATSGSVKQLRTHYVELWNWLYCHDQLFHGVDPWVSIPDPTKKVPPRCPDVPEPKPPPPPPGNW